MKQRFGLLGRKLSHSLSPQIHAMFGDYSYELFEREPDDLDAFFADTSLTGFNVTIPYKLEALRRCDALSKTAKRIGAVNTVIRRADGTLFGDNTDAFGFSYMAAQCGVTFRGKKVLILGTGGASRTAQTVASDGDAKEIILVSRSGENNYQNLSRHADADVIVNTTPVGMFPKNLETPLDLLQFKNRPAVLDLIYNPRRTALLLQAQSLGLSNANGMAMLVAQGKRSAELFLNQPLDDNIIALVTQKMLQMQTNLVLIGMPGCGKSTVAALLGKRLGRTVLDTDAQVEAQTGKSIPQIFAEHGEKAFRDAESAACEALGRQLGSVIATGGGAILRERNRNALRQNGTVVYLKRSIDALAREGRPLSKDKAALQAIFNERKAIYESFADYTVDVDDDANETAERILSCIFS